MVEMWKDCYGLEEYIKVSNLGNIYRKKRKGNPSGGIAKTFIAGHGYEYVKIGIDGKTVNRRVHRLVLQTFNPISNYDDMTVNHIDGDKLNNSLENLEWMTHRENIDHALKTGLIERKTPREIECFICREVFKERHQGQKYCSVLCNNVSDRVVDRPTKDELYKLLKSNSFTKVGEMFGVSDNAIRLWCKTYEIPHKASYYRRYK